MMKKVLVVGIVAVMMMGMAAAAQAAFDASWAINFKCATAANGNGYTTSVFSTKTGNSDGYGTEDQGYTPSPSPAIYAYTMLDGHEVIKDQRDSFKGVDMVWDITIKGVNQAEGFTGPAYVFVWNPADGLLKTDFAPLDPNEKIELYKADANGNRGALLWAVNPAVNGTGAAGNANTFQGTYAIGDRFQLVASTVPEPGSMLAMLSGLVGLVGYGIRRRK